MANTAWYPGHVAKTTMLLKKSLKLVDVVVELADARIPLTSRHPGLNRLTGGKPRLLVLNKADLAEEKSTELFVRKFNTEGLRTVAVDAKSGAGINRAVRAVQEMAGIAGARRVRCLLAGMPNVGKSTFINRVVGKNAARAADRPGITRGQQWIRLGPSVDLLDMPGILMPRLEKGEALHKLAAAGILDESVYDPLETALFIWEWFSCNRSGVLPPADDGYSFLKTLGESCGFYQRGGVVDENKAAQRFLLDLRAGRWGRFTLDAAPAFPAEN